MKNLQWCCVNWMPLIAFLEKERSPLFWAAVSLCGNVPIRASDWVNLEAVILQQGFYRSHNHPTGVTWADVERRD